MRASLIMFFALGFSTVSSAATKTWTGASDNNFSNSNNWNPSGQLGSDDDLVFPLGGTVHNDISSLLVHSIALTGSTGGVTLSGNPISLSAGGVSSTQSSGINVIAFDVA